MKTDGNAIKCDLRPIGLTVDAGTIVASVVGGPKSGYSFPQDAGEVEANAQLIAAAPELLGFLEMIANGGINEAGEATIESEARALIAKATRTK